MLAVAVVLICLTMDVASFSQQPRPSLETMCKSAVAGAATAAMIGALAVLPVWADELGRETEAPTLVTGETVLICVKRGPLGACTKTEMRTAENENDVSEKYFRQPTELVKRKDAEARTVESNEGNALIERLKKQTEDNREKNELLVKQRTMINDSSASFGPFDAQVLILNEDGKGFTLLANPQAMRLKKAGFISDDRKFLKQPTAEQLADALEPEVSGPNFLDRFLGGG
jgi:hypothetical protein